MTLTQGLHISAGAMKVHQSVISITSNNIANMNTEGYHKQKAHLGTLVLGLPIGDSVLNQVKTSAGVELINVKRYETSFIGSYYRNQLSNQAYLEEKSKGLEDIVNMFDELAGRGLDTSLENFYKSLDNLNQYPNDMSARVNVLNSASTLTSSINLIANNLNKLKDRNLGDGSSQASLENSGIYANVQELNATLDELASINNLLLQSQTGTLENNNLLDRRDLILDNLAKFGNFDIDILQNGVANVSIGGIKIVGGSTVLGKLDVQTAKSYDEYCTKADIENKNTCNAVLSIQLSDGGTIQNVNNKFTSGKIGGLIEEPKDGDLNPDKVIEYMDKLAKTIADVFNAIQTRDGAFYLDNATGKIQLCNDNLDQYALFTTNDGTDDITASNITINPLLLMEGGYNKIAAAYFPEYDPTALDPLENIDLNAVGNATNIMDMIKTKSDNTGTEFAEIGNLSFNDFYSSILSKLTSKYQNTNDEINVQSSVIDALDNRKAAETSVDLNEELTDLVKSQTAYAASARVFTTCNTLLETLINLGL